MVVTFIKKKNPQRKYEGKGVRGDLMCLDDTINGALSARWL